MEEKKVIGEGGENISNIFKFNWRIWQKADGTFSREIKIRADTKSEAEGAMFDSLEATATAIKNHKGKLNEPEKVIK